MSILCGVLGGLCLLYYLFAVNYAGLTSSFLGFWLIAAIIFFVAAFVLKYIYIAKIIKVISLIIIIFCLVIFFIVECLIISKMNSYPETKVDYLIVLGAQVRGERVTKSLAKRLDKAVEYLNENPSTKVIVSGGQGKGENITESEAMSRYLLEKGLDKNRIIQEDRSTSTKENLEFSLKLIKEESPRIALVTNNFHVYRAGKIAEKVGIENIQTLAAESDNRLLLNYMVREFFAIIKAIFN